jgi:putative flippase GtrA
MSVRQLSHLLPQSIRARLKEGQSYIIIGVGNVIFTYVVYLLVNLFAPYTVAYTVSFCSGILFSAYLNSRFSFTTRLTVGRFAAFTLVCLINYFICVAILKLLVETLGLHEAVAPILVVAVVVPISFVGTRLALVGSLTGGTGSSGGGDRTGVGNNASRGANDEVL